MRKIVMLQPEQPKLTEEQIKAQIGRVVDLFDAYLEEYRAKSIRTKHGLMGPVAKILDRAKAGQWDDEPLVGFALRIHEMSQPNQQISLNAATKLREGIETLMQLCRDVPVPRLAMTIDQIDYSLYWQRRVKTIKWLEEQAAALRAFLMQRYGGDNGRFAAAWGLKKGKGSEPTISGQQYFGKNSKRYREGTPQLKADMDAFYNRMGEQGVDPEAVVEDDEEV